MAGYACYAGQYTIWLGVMKRFVEPSTKAQQLFFLALVLLGALALLANRLPDFLPSISLDPSVASEQVLNQSLWIASLNTLFYLGLSFHAVHYVHRAVRSRQWPPEGMSVPFRTEIKEIKNPRNAWAVLAFLLLLYAAQIAMPWHIYTKQRELFELLMTAQPAASPEASSDRACLWRG